MKLFTGSVMFALCLWSSMAVPALAAFPTSQQKAITGTVTRVYGNQIVFRTNRAALYTAETSGAVLVKKNGSPMRLPDVAVGDKLEVRGQLWPDNSLNAAHVRNMSLYTHSGTFSGKITGINPSDASFTLQSAAYGTQVIRTNELTSYRKNSVAATFGDMQLGYTVTVKGLWERSRSEVVAREVAAKIKLVNITVSGSLVMVSPGALTVMSNNTLYGVDLAGAKIVDKNGKILPASRLSPGHSVRVQGKHISGSVQITSATVKDYSVTR